LKLLRNESNLGLTRSLNRGLDMARGRYLARQDVDDISLPQRLEKQAAFLEAHPGVALLGAAAWRVDGEGKPLPIVGRHPGGHAAIRLKMLLNNAFFHAAACARLDVMRAHGLAYDPAFTYAQDYDLWSRLMDFGQGANLHEPLIKFRVHAGQLSSTARPAQQECGDRTAIANFARAGLERDFTPGQISLLRRAGLGPRDLPPGERREQLRLLQRLFALVRPSWPGWDRECDGVRQELFLHVRRYIFQPPTSAAMAAAQAAMAAADPLGAVADAWALWRRRRENRGGE
ncbi:MAG: hypothetical protein C0405_13365, partial [Desulfovibrio sp.]|nr:hypothetical protein [Desulfovibrio sp.]